MRNIINIIQVSLVQKYFIIIVLFQLQCFSYINILRSHHKVNNNPSNLLTLTMTDLSMNAESWDPINGVWIGNKAASNLLSDLPTPLYILGYGSLIWKPGLILEDIQAHSCECIGYIRCFAQKSIDHRGTYEFPGLVLTLMDTSIITESTDVLHSCLAKVWLIPECYKKELIEELDYREKGGYTRHIIDIKLLESTSIHEAGTITKAVVYTALPENPNFFEVAKSHSYHSIIRISDIISSAIGPSGRNIDYLLNLNEYLNENAMSDVYLNRLTLQVKSRIGPWKSKWTRTNDNIDLSSIQLNDIVAFGSNEFNQTLLESIGNSDVYFYPHSLYNSHAITNRQTSLIINEESKSKWLFAGGGNSGVLTKDGLLLIWGKIVKDLSNHSVIGLYNVIGAAFSHDNIVVITKDMKIFSFISNFYPKNEFYVMHNLNDNLDQSIIKTIDFGIPVSVEIFNIVKLEEYKEKDISKIAIGMKHVSVLDENGYLFSSLVNANIMTIDKTKYTDISCGLNFDIALDEKGRLWSWGDNKHGSLGRETTIRYDYCPKLVNLDDDLLEVRWLRVCSGWSHIVARGVRRDGSLVVIGWGKSNMCQYGFLDDKIIQNYHPRVLILPENNNILEIWTGSEFTIVCDDNHCIWSTGWNEHGNCGIELDETSKIYSSWNMISNIQIQDLWTESIACGGAHVLCIPNRDSL